MPGAFTSSGACGLYGGSGCAAPAWAIRTAVLSYRIGSSGMDVYLIPVGADEYALYSDVKAAPKPEAAGAPSSGRIGGLVHRAQRAFARLEQEPEPAAGGSPGWRGRLRRSVSRRINEQRLLWQLRHERTATVVSPDDCPDALAIEIVRAHLRRQADRHRLWLVVDSVAFVASWVLILLPGPNVLAYYLAFSLVGHYFSLRGARRGRAGVQWSARRDAALSELRHVIALPTGERDHQVREIANRLNLPDLPAFFARTAPRSA
jgi:Mitochondrial K+-H+ exchange-related